MKIPSKDLVKFVIKRVLENKKVGSQKELSELVVKELNKNKKQYALSGKRARLIALEIPEVKVLIEVKKGKIPKKCPCCKSKLVKTYTKNLLGGKILVKLKCLKCGYKGLEGKWIPKRYEFSL